MRWDNAARSASFAASALCALAFCIPCMARGEDARPQTERIASFREAITRAALDNPEVMAAWHGFEASRSERRMAKGNYFPRLDLVAQAAREQSETPLRQEDSYSLDSSRVTLTQMLFDGFATRNDVSRLDHAMRARYYELAARAEAVALDATQAYFDVLRRQELVRLAEDNYIEHRRIYNDIESRVIAGVTRRVDLEQASARLALAETNLLIEAANLHDVTARFQRVIGSLPADSLSVPELPAASIPDDVNEALRLAYVHHPQLRAAAATLESARAARANTFAPMLPRLDLRLSRQLDDDTDGIDGSYEQSTAELVVTYNVFKGGSDMAQRRMFDERMRSARELRESACRDVRQTLVIAHNDIRNQVTQLAFLNRNQLATGKARRVYREQFSIGQRSLLDLLDSENEYFEIRRRYVNARFDLELAQARTLSAMGVLLDALRIRGRDREARMDVEVDVSGTGVRCPLGTPLPTYLERDEILSRIESDPRLQRPAIGP